MIVHKASGHELDLEFIYILVTRNITAIATLII